VLRGRRTPRGDLDFDADVDEGDRELFAQAFGKSEGQAGYLAAADLDGDRGRAPSPGSHPVPP
jgi:hypothetical protein